MLGDLLRLGSYKLKSVEMKDKYEDPVGATMYKELITQQNDTKTFFRIINVECLPYQWKLWA